MTDHKPNLPDESTRLISTNQDDTVATSSSNLKRVRPSSCFSLFNPNDLSKPINYDNLNQPLGLTINVAPSYLTTGSIRELKVDKKLRGDLGNRSWSGDSVNEDDELDDDDISDIVTSNQLIEESGFILKLALPLIISYLLQNMIPLASVYSLGHLGSTELAASALSNMFASVTGWSVVMGMATALDTLCSQYLKILLIGAPPYILFECLKKFLQTQGFVSAPTYLLLAVIPFNLGFNYLLIFHPSTSIGFDGAPLAVVLTNWLIMILGVLYIRFLNGYQAWGGWSKRSLTGWYPFLKLGIPGVLMICAEWWSFEIMGLAASYLGDLPLAAHAVNITITNLFYMIPFGLGIASSNRMGNLLGNRTPNRARLCAYCGIILALIFASLNSSILLIFTDFWSNLFTSSHEVSQFASTLLPIAALNQVFEGLSGVAGGLLRGQGRQKLGAYVNLISYYIISLPIGLYLAFFANWGIHGLWWGLTLALIVSASTLTMAILSTNWDNMIVDCLTRLTKDEELDNIQVT